jgi:cytochrome c biogenesis protein CcdA/thiol-disulfide isomerase/thioredoxin
MNSKILINNKNKNLTKINCKNKFFINFIVIMFFLYFLFVFLFSSSVFALDDCLDENGEDQCVVDPNSFILDIPINDLNTNINTNSTEFIDNIDKNILTMVYFTGIGCPHCAKIDNILFNDIIVNNKNLVIIEYEVKNKQENAQYMLYYNNIYNSGYDIPVAIVDTNNIFYYKEILDFVDNNFNNLNKNIIPFPKNVYEDISDTFENININNLKGRPIIWKNNRALEKTCDCNIDSSFLIDLLDADNVDLLLENLNYNFIENASINYSGGAKDFKNAVQLEGWNFYWNNKTNLDKTKSLVLNNKETVECKDDQKISFLKVSFLALADSVNPCALAVLLLMLMSIVIANPNNKKIILLSGLCFILAVFIMYFIYGLLLIKMFSFLDPFRILVYKIVAVFAIILGILEIKDFFNYKPGSIGTEMPVGLRPKMKKFVSKITSPKGAFFMGLFVTLFLLPCTIGPYIILGSMLSIKGIITSVPLLLWYNVLFILPMLIIVLLIYFGMNQIKDVQEWKEKNIKYLHLIAGIIIVIIGILMFFGLI